MSTRLNDSPFTSFRTKIANVFLKEKSGVHKCHKDSSSGENEYHQNAFVLLDNARINWCVLPVYLWVFNISN